MNTIFPFKEGHDTVLEHITGQNIKISWLSYTLMLDYIEEGHFNYAGKETANIICHPYKFNFLFL
jgi:hypothetical protein